jgi:hypothetical protein
MRVAATSVVLALGIAMVSSPAAANHTSHEDNRLNYKDCDGRNLTARWDITNTILRANFPGTAAGPDGADLKYLTWDGSCRTLAWDADARQFVHTFDGKSQSSLIVNYVTWDDAKWSATRAGTGFFHVFVAGKDEEQLETRVKDAAVWLQRNKSDNQAARNMARLLTSAAGE